jgi:hypothetical protein
MNYSLIKIFPMHLQHHHFKLMLDVVQEWLYNVYHDPSDFLFRHVNSYKDRDLFICTALTI